MVPTRSTRTFTRTALKRMGVDVTTVQDAVSRVAAEAAAGEEGTMMGADIKAAGAEAEWGTRIPGTINKKIKQGTTIKTTSISKATIMKAVIIMDLEATTQDLPGDRVNSAGDINKPPKEEIK